jgi:rRNA maturation RNase YbeY
MIEVALVRDADSIRFTEERVRRIVQYVCRREKRMKADLSFVFIGDRKMKALNKKYLNHDFQTDIMTFPMEPHGVNAEIYINVDQAKRQAKEYRKTIVNEMIRLIVHGTLHAMGYDDRKPVEKERMFARQERYVAKLSLIVQ